MNRRMLPVGLLVVLVSLVMGACTTPQPGVSNKMGTVTAKLNGAPQDVTEAARQTLEDMDLVIVSSGATGIDGKVVARSAQEVKVTVEVERAGENLSELSIRVGMLGDEDVSLSILEKIKRRLE